MRDNTESARELLEDIKTGDYVRIRYGTDSDQSMLTGTVLKWSDHVLSLKRDDGKISKIRLDDSLRSLEPMDESEREENSNRVTVDMQEKANASHSDASQPEFRVLRQLETLSPAQPYVFVLDNEISGIKQSLKLSQNTELKRSMNGVIDSLNAAVKSKEISYKYHNIRAKLHQTWYLCETNIEYEILYELLGVLAIVARDYEYSLEPLVRANRFLLAAYASSMGNLTESAQVFSLCALLNEETVEINQYISESFVARNDVDTLNVMLEKNKSNDAVCEKLASCAYMLFKEARGKLCSDITPYDKAYDVARQLLDSVPREWNRKDTSAVSYWQAFKKYTYASDKIKDGQEVLLTGKIMMFNPMEKWGFISPNHYFYVEQIYDNSEHGILLRKMLSIGLWNQLEVSFQLGESGKKPGQSAATAIELTENGYQESQQRVAKAAEIKQVHKGFVEDFFPEFLSGRIQSNGKKYNFKLDAIVDPWLKAYYRESFSPKEQDVYFEIADRKAVNIYWRDFSEDERSEFSGMVTENEKLNWNNFLIRKKESSDEFSLPERDPYENYRYIPLAEWPPTDQNKNVHPLTWGGKTIIGRSRDDISIGESRQENIVEQTVVNTKKRFVEDGRFYAERARKASLEGNFEIAEANFEKALARGGFNEAVVCDYISLCIRQDSKVEQALQLLDKYASQISSEKLLNIKISVYDKKKDYKVLCSLYDEAYHTSKTVSKKSHSLFRLIDAYTKLGEYEKALDTCKRWETFYKQNRFSTDAEKLKKASPSIERQKAICLYHLGCHEESRKIATDLVRANPADTAANSILDGTLMSSVATADSVGILVSDDLDVSAYEENYEFEETESESQMSRFVRIKIQQTDIAVSLKSRNLKDGKYIGSVKEAMEDVRKLTSGRRVSVKTRSESLFAACRLLEQLEQRVDRGNLPNPFYKYRLAGRAMASWGDFMVSQIGQLDTTRMAYLFALKTLTPTKNGMEQDWANSYNRYIKSFFLARVGANSLDEYINQQTNSRAKDPANTSIIVGNRIQDVLLSEFVIGILRLIDAISNQKDRLVILIDDLYYKNPELRESICQQLTCFIKVSIPENIDRNMFFDCLMDASKQLNEQMDILHRDMVEIGNELMLHSLTDSMISNLDQSKWTCYLNATDIVRLNRIHYILKRSQDYYNSGDFENRSDCLRATIHEVKELLQIIQNEPTDVSYDIFLPFLEQIALKLTEKQTDLYQEYLPKLSWRETIQPFRTPEGQIQIQLSVENECNYQSADSLEITSVQGAEIIWYDRGVSIPTLRGGEDIELGLLVVINDAASASGSFTATIGYSYKCSDSPQNTITKNQEIEFTFIIHDENFELLNNPFQAYEGKLMDDETMFIGRSTQMSQILNMICQNENGDMNYGRAVAMFGQTRTGKSSLLYHLKRELLVRYQDDILIWDMGNIGELPDSKEFMAVFLYTLLYVGSEAISENNAISDIIEKEGLVPPLKEIQQEPVFAITYFNTYMKKLNSILKREKKIIVLIIDEFTYLHGYIQEGKIPVEFMRFWKALLQNYCVFAIVAAQDDMPEFMREYQNEFACMELLKLTYLEERDAKLLIQQPLENANHREVLFHKDGSVDLLYSLTAGSAYLIIILCSKLINYLNDKGAYMITKGIVNDFLRTRAFGPNSFLSEVHFEAQMQERGHRELDEANRAILLEIARLSRTAGYAIIGDIVCDDLTREEIQRYVDRLVDRNVLRKEGRNKYWIQVKLLELWLIDTMGHNTMNTLRKNAFVVGSQASGDSFYGRTEEIADLESSIFRGVEAVHLVSPTRIGKSSLVSYVFEKNRKMPERLCVKMTMGECLNAYDFWKTLIDELRGSIYDAGLWNCEFERYYGLIRDTVDPQDEDWFIYFKGPLKSILKAIQKCSYRLVLAIDEFDSVDRIFDQKTHYFQVLRSIYSEPEYVTSGVIISRKRLQLFEEKCKDISTFHGVFREKTLRAFSNEDILLFYQAMEKHGFSLSAEGKDKFEYFTGRMPYFCCMFADRMIAHGWTGDSYGSNEVVQIFEECIPQINRHYNDLIERLESDKHTETVYYLSIGLMLPTITKRHIQNLIAMGVLVSEIEDGSIVYYAFSRDFMTYFSTKPLDLPAWEILTLSERKIKEIFKREYPVLESLTYERLKDTDASEIIRAINEEYPEMRLNLGQIKGYCENLSVHKANPTVIDVLTLSKIVGIMLDTWESRFFKYFTGESEWKFKLEQIKKIRNPMAHAHIEYVREDVLATCMKYCDELIHMEIG